MNKRIYTFFIKMYVIFYNLVYLYLNRILVFGEFIGILVNLLCNLVPRPKRLDGFQRMGQKPIKLWC